MPIISPGWTGHRRPGSEKLPPGQYLVTDFPVLAAGPTPKVDSRWSCAGRSAAGSSGRRPIPARCC
jgi:hypothetical protein